MDLVNFTVLDIGHGNCTLIHSDSSVVLIDAAIGASVQDILNTKKLTKIDSIIISHTDADHIGGVIALLLDDDLDIGKVYINSDSTKGTKVWGDFRSALSLARSSKGTKVEAAINKDTSDLCFTNFQLEVLSPSPIDCLVGPGSQTLDGDKLDANSMSVVLRLIHENEKIALIPGDMDQLTLNFLKEETDCLKAKILIFPHHGGLSKRAKPSEFAKELCDLVEPELIIFSNSRNKHNNPRKEIISGIKNYNALTNLACTQLSKECCEEDSRLSSAHLIASFPSLGEVNNHSCAGTINIQLNGKSTDINSSLTPHLKYISNFENRKCR
jgi:competence protein ComEC